jgi:hypothetical protein
MTPPNQRQFVGVEVANRDDLHPYSDIRFPPLGVIAKAPSCSAFAQGRPYSKL